MTCKSTGPQPATILIVGEAPGADEIRTGEPFVGLSGKELTRMLHDAGIIRQACRITNVTMERPEGNDINQFFATRTAATTDHKFLAGRWCHPAITKGLEALRQEVASTNPTVILALGDTALWALTGESGITKWRGSHMDLQPTYGGPHPTGVTVIPTYHPNARSLYFSAGMTDTSWPCSSGSTAVFVSAEAGVRTFVRAFGASRKCPDSQRTEPSVEPYQVAE